jgi:hypothetical protein
LGTAAAVRRATGYALSVDNRLLVEGIVSRVRSELGEELHTELDAEGRAMTFEVAVRSVRDWLAERAPGKENRGVAEPNLDLPGQSFGW